MDLALSIDFENALPLQRQIYDELKHAIVHRRLASGQRLPSTRALAESLGVARITVSESYDQLRSEGYIEAVQGSGTFVAERIPEQFTQVKYLQRTGKSSNNEIVLSEFGKSIDDDAPFRSPPLADAINFRYGTPLFEGTSLSAWKRILTKHLQSPDVFDYAEDLLGYKQLREAICEYITRARGVICTPAQILITNGSQHALYLISRLLLNDGDAIGMENPGYLGALRIFRANGARIVPVDIDDQGLSLDKLQSLKQLKCVYTTPSHQFPTGSTLSLSRRLELLNWAERNNALIIEDDYDSEYRYKQRPIPALQGVRQNKSVIYVGTFSKVMFPSLRLGYLVLPEDLVRAFARARWLNDRQSSMLEQFALAEFIKEGHLERHIRKMRVSYDERRQMLVTQLQKRLGKKVRILGENAGMHIMIKLKAGIPDSELVMRATKAGVNLVSATAYYCDSPKTGEWILGYSELKLGEIKEGVRRLATVVR
jgi:GntR family transcriptional regulator / MocR family aminotransferase